MITRVSHVNVFVLDLDRAKRFYTETLGFEVRSDTTLDGFRWLTVGLSAQPDLQILLAYPAPPDVQPGGCGDCAHPRRQGRARWRRP